MITCGHWLLGPTSQIANNLDANVTGIEAGCTNSTDDIERWENVLFPSILSVTLKNHCTT